MSNVVEIPFQRHQVGRLAEDIKALVYSRAGQISMAEAIGTLEIVKNEIICEARGAV